MISKNFCPLDHTLNLIGTKWKSIVLFHLMEESLRSGILQKKYLEFLIKCSHKQFANLKEMD